MEQNDCIFNEDSVVITKAAQHHFRRLIEKEEVEGMNLRLFVVNPGTAHADISITFCPPGEELSTDFKIPFNGYDCIMFIEQGSKIALQGATIDFAEDAMGGMGQLSIKAPHLKGHVPEASDSLKDRIQYVLDTEINPTLAGHGGAVNLVDILEDKIVIVHFQGGCHGCGMANVTLKQGIETTLKEKFPELLEIRDITDHNTGENPYYT